MQPYKYEGGGPERPPPNGAEYQIKIYQLCSPMHQHPSILIGINCQPFNQRGVSMTNSEHLDILKQGVDVWNKWRKENPVLRPNFTGAVSTVSEQAEHQ